MSRFHVCFQKDAMQCGIACLQMICVHYGKKYSQDFLSNICYATTEVYKSAGKTLNNKDTDNGIL